MVSIKEASDSAMAFARVVLGSERTADARLEEVVSASVDGEDAWLITLSIPDGLIPFAQARTYKVFAVLKRNGEVTSMKIRELSHV
jgi:hypothetical protein